MFLGPNPKKLQNIQLVVNKKIKTSGSENCVTPLVEFLISKHQEKRNVSVNVNYSSM